MKFPSYAAMLVILVASARAQDPVSLAHGNVPGEPHHHLKIENEYVRVYYVEAPPHESTLLHQHDHDYIYVSLGPSDVVNAIANKPEIHLQLKDGETHFTRGGFAHVARNLADTPFRNITIELLKPQGEAHNLCAQVLMSSPKGVCSPTPSARKGAHGFVVEPQFETAAAYLNLVRLDPETSGGASVVLPKSLVVVLSGDEVQLDEPDCKVRILREGQTAWVDTKLNWAASNPSKTPSTYLQITFKDSATEH